MPQIFGIAQTESLPGLAADGAQKQVTVDRYGELACRSEIVRWAEQGAYFRALGSSTPMGIIAQTIQTSFAATNCVLCMVNGDANKSVIPHYIRLINQAAGASTTSSLAAIAIDSANRYSSGGNDLTSLIVNSQTAVGPTSGVTVLRGGAITSTAAGGGTRYVANMSLKVQAAPCWTVGDEVLFTFGDVNAGSQPAPMSGTTPITIVKNVGPVVLGGQNSSLLLHLWNPANASTAPSWAYEIAWWER